MLLKVNNCAVIDVPNNELSGFSLSYGGWYKMAFRHVFVTKNMNILIFILIKYE